MTRSDAGAAPLRLGLIGRAHGLGGAFRVVGAADWYTFAPGATLLLDGKERALRTVARAAAGSGERVTLEIRDAE